MIEPLRPLFRPGTWDGAIWADVVERNEYELPAELSPEDVIIDVGAHIGAFSCACLLRGAGYVYAFEANRANYGLAIHNLAPWGDAACVQHRAVWRSDIGPGIRRLCWTGSTHEPNTGGGNVVFCEPVPQGVIPNPADVWPLALDDLLGQRHPDGKPMQVRLLKLDCEGSEWPILLTSNRLDQIQEIVGEFHEIGGPYNDATIPARAQVEGYSQYCIEDLVHHLQAHGFDVSWKRSELTGEATNLGKFRAVRATDELKIYCPDAEALPVAPGGEG